MTMRELCYLILTCDESEKEKIARHLLDKRLVVCVKFIPIDAMYWWQGSIAREHKAVLLMESSEDLFAEIEKELTDVHSYDTFVLTQIPMTNVSMAARQWMEGELT